MLLPLLVAQIQSDLILCNLLNFARLLCALYHQNALLKIFQRFTGNQRVTLVTPGNLRLICLTQINKVLKNTANFCGVPCDIWLS